MEPSAPDSSSRVLGGISSQKATVLQELKRLLDTVPICFDRPYCFRSMFLERVTDGFHRNVAFTQAQVLVVLAMVVVEVDVADASSQRVNPLQYWRA